jgi:hypothetical protein
MSPGTRAGMEDRRVKREGEGEGGRGREKEEG